MIEMKVNSVVSSVPESLRDPNSFLGVFLEEKGYGKITPVVTKLPLRCWVGQ